MALFYFPIESEDNIQEKLAEHSKVAVVYWSGTGNTEAMAAFVAEGAKEKGADAVLLTSSEFEPMFASCEGKLGGKKIALFGSYGWGDGEWMRNWEETCRSDGAVLACESVICNNAPNDEAEVDCKALGAAIAV